MNIKSHRIHKVLYLKNSSHFNSKPYEVEILQSESHICVAHVLHTATSLIRIGQFEVLLDFKKPNNFVFKLCQFIKHSNTRCHAQWSHVRLNKHKDL